MTKFVSLAALVAGALTPFAATAQDHSGHQGHSPAQSTPTPHPHQGKALTQEAPANPVDHSAMDHSDMDHATMDHANGQHGVPVVPDLPGSGSGTARLPAIEGGMHGVHLSTGDWMVMAHGYATTAYSNVTGPRGDDQLFVQTMGMLTGETDLGARGCN